MTRKWILPALLGISLFILLNWNNETSVQPVKVSENLPSRKKEQKQADENKGTTQSSSTQVIADETDSPINKNELEQLESFVSQQAIQMNRIQNNPEQIDKELNRVAESLSSQQARLLGEIAQDPDKNSNERVIAIDLLTRQPKKNQNVLLDFLSRKDHQVEEESEGHYNHREMLEQALSLQSLRSLEKDLTSDDLLKERLFQISQSDIPEATKIQILKSLVASKQGRKHWTEVAQSLSQTKE